MKHFRALLYKFILTTAILFITLGFLYGVSFGDILTISALLTIGAYLIGDLFVLPYLGNTVATMADFAIVFLGVLLLGTVYIEEPIRYGVASFLSALFLAIGEIFFHRYLLREGVMEEREHRRPARRLNYQTEFAEEDVPEKDDLYPIPEVPPRVSPPIYHNPEKQNRNRDEI